MADQVFFFDSDWEVLARVRSLMPEARLMPRTYSVGDIYAVKKRFHPEMVHIDPSFYNGKTMKACRKFGMKTWINSLGETDRKLTANPDFKLAEEMVTGGARMIQTDLVEFWVNFRSSANSR